MNEKGTAADNDVHFAQPGPPNFPKTFCAPCPMKATPNASRSGTVTHDAEVEVILLSIDSSLPTSVNHLERAFNYKSVCCLTPREKTERVRRNH